MIYVYSDTHFDHKNIIFYCNRREDWQEKFLALHKKIVGPKDTVLFLGDLGFGSPKRMASLLAQLNFKRFIAVLGNHDKSTNWLYECGVSKVLNEHGQELIITDDEYPVKVVLVAKNDDPRTGQKWAEGDDPFVAISHEPYEKIDWPYLSAHTHNNPIPWGYNEYPYRIHRGMGRNVSVEMINYTPIPIPFLIGDEGWIRKYHEHYYKHLFGFEKSRKRRDVRKDI